MQNNRASIRKLCAATCTLGAFGVTESRAAPAFIDGGQVVTVPGTQTSPWAIGDQLYVGYTSDGTLHIDSGGSVSATDAIVSNVASAVGTVTVTGPNATFTTNSISVGDEGAGSLSIASGGTVTNSTAIVGRDVASSGSITLSGAGSTWHSTAVFGVADAGAGSLDIVDGGALVSADSYLSFRPTGAGTITVSGAGSSWVNSGTLYAGYAGSTSVSILAGAKLQSATTYLGNLAGSAGTLTVSGAGSTFVNGGALVVGNGGTGTLNVLGAATVTSASGDIGATAGSTGAVTVSGAGSTWTTTGELDVGDGGSGSLAIADGAQVTSATASVGKQSGSTGSVTVSGAGSTWTTTGELDVGDGGSGSLAIADGAQATSATASVGKQSGSTGAVTVSGAGANWTSTSGLVVGNDGAGTLNIASGATVAAPAGLVVAANAGSTGTLNVTSGATLQTQSLAAGGGATHVAFDGATLIAIGANASFISGFTSPLGISSGGLTIDDGGNPIGTDTSAFAGSGALTKAGSGTLVLAGDSTYTGGTTIAAGTLQLGNGGATGSIAGDVSNGGTLVFDRSNTYTYDGAISGAGNVVQNGGGVTTLTGASTYTGATTIAAGTLALAGAGSIAASSRVIADATFDISAAGATANIRSLAGGGTVNVGAQHLNLTNAADTFDGALTGTGQFSLAAGTEFLAGDSGAFAGRTTVDGGTLGVTGTLGGTLDVNSGGSLIGTGSVGATTIHAGGAVSPGVASLGTLRVNGDLAFEPGSTYFDLNITPALQSDLIAVTGGAALHGASVVVNQGSGIYLPGSEWRVLTAANGVSGTFGSLAQGYPYIDLGFRYDANNAYLVAIRNQQPLCQPGMTANECSTARGVESLGENATLAREVASQQSLADARRAFQLLSGQVYASTRSVLIEDSHFARDAILDRLRTASGPERPASAPSAELDPGLWIQPFGSWSTLGRTSDRNAATLDRSVGGFFAGADDELNSHWRVGGLFGYSRTSFDADDVQSSGHSDDYHIGAYVGSQWGALAIRSGVSWTWHDVSTSRSVVFPGVADAPSAGYHANTLQIFSEVAYQMQMNALRFEPFANLAYVRLHTDSFAENGDVAALSGAASTDDVGYSTLGLRASLPVALAPKLALSVSGSAGWRHAFGNATPATTMAFAGSSPFTVTGVPIARDAAVVTVGIDSAPNQKLNVGIAYSGQYGGRLRDSGVNAYASWKF
ncbi:autotransporter outer membrane beta-barrel domain-containing protein [Paraburkholderia caballeronis]|uniref:autotransporter outer membrane beta-barrel domain-containing protein n=1 Tax=Paraburkholderia caballeronis TaxID=416943 RepID=UPI0010D4637F|nr:autotransporter domain-containing protein [Paraburkholderia caballeronis]TDV09449.1 outer membrane autotransporter protein [Paraburkholderia caballeronis]TDV13720.1 outer membrane autotransporter protein [Paraburkholderia caballeronis]TDV22902.1 outer membrane autotransporter protein [Paraburkholderia caballeronis]